MLKIVGLFLTLCVFLSNACGPLEPTGTKDNQNETSPSTDSTKQDPQNRRDTKNEPNTNSPSLKPGNEPLKKRIDEKTLLEWIRKVDAQKTTWGCGNVQCGYAVVASRSDVDFFNPNDIANYPASVHLIFPNRQVKASVSKFVPALDSLRTEKYADGTEHFIVGALPSDLPAYLKRLGVKDAHHLALKSLSKMDFINEIMENVNKNRPLIAMSVVDPEKFLLHYVSLVGVSDDGNKVLILDTTGKDLERLMWADTDLFMKSLDTQSFINRLMNYMPMLEGIKGVAERFGIQITKIIPSDRIGTMGNFNLVSFK